MSPSPEPWHADARRLRTEGLTQREICARLQQSKSAVHAALNETPVQKFIFKRNREAKLRKPRPMAARKTGGRFVSLWKSKTDAPGVITPEMKREAILAFSNHEIPRAELMRRITPRNKWSGAGLLRVESEAS